MKTCNQTNTLPSQYRLSKLHLIHSIINHHFQIIHLDNLAPQIWEKRQGKITMRNSTVIRTVRLSTFCIYMNPLMVQRCICKKTNTVLRDFQIIRNSNLLTYQFLKIRIRINNHFIHNLNLLKV